MLKPGITTWRTRTNNLLQAIKHVYWHCPCLSMTTCKKSPARWDSDLTPIQKIGRILATHVVQLNSATLLSRGREIGMRNIMWSVSKTNWFQVVLLITELSDMNHKSFRCISQQWSTTTSWEKRGIWWSLTICAWTSHDVFRNEGKRTCKSFPALLVSVWDQTVASKMRRKLWDCAEMGIERMPSNEFIRGFQPRYRRQSCEVSNTPGV